EALRHQATHDALTGIWNRAAILDALDRELARNRREGRPFGVLVADLDHFKRVNDTLGHLAGDAVLRDAVARLQSVVRPYDSLGRYGGEEFLAVLSGCDLPQAVGMAERLRRSLEVKPIVWNGTAVPITLSIGVTACTDGGQTDAQMLIHAADEALYR